jgi:hypothetical protein
MSDEIHGQAMEVCLRYKKAEADLMEVLQKVEKYQVHLKRGHSSLFRYVVDELKLSENNAYTLITISRKARQVPDLAQAVKSGQISMSNARRVSAVLTPSNKDEWLAKARELSNRELEKEIARVRPQALTPEKVGYVTADRVRLELGLQEEVWLKLQRVQDLLSQARRCPVGLEEALEVLVDGFLKKQDPLEKAKRAESRKATDSPQKRVEDHSVPQETGTMDSLVTLREVSDSQSPKPRAPIPAATIHQLQLRDQGRCAQVLPDGRRCQETRWLEIHHRIPISQGGKNDLENLLMLCTGHHRNVHQSWSRSSLD